MKLYNSISLILTVLYLLSCSSHEDSIPLPNEAPVEIGQGAESQDEFREQTTHLKMKQPAIPGKFAFNVPQNMMVGETYDITFIISKSLNEEVLFKERDSSIFEVRNVEVASMMKAEIYAPEQKNFEIHSRTDHFQKVFANDKTVWKWHVKPLKKGSHKLIIVLHAKYNLDGNMTPQSRIVYNEEIHVETTLYTTVHTFFIAHRQWLFGTFFIPFFIYLYSNWKSKKTTHNGN